MTFRRPKSNFINEDINPCIEEGNLSHKCLEINGYNYSKCTEHFENYKTCKKFWGKICKSRRSANISPVMPCKKEREKILKLKAEGISVISINE